ncbi:heme-degrading domain-containing protein [Alpinimonas psychrophila]|uniref:Uncharacterized protein (UPF0303 family) n=1 Tax=Alpinimonas psychrophila TaxID=748908 RepID=A0A7W3PNA3_9MICO|nr:heme-degrading domain-containing protein [Alpinimonas psychrophila]MBA8828031.1 uncharacterized protein (UPF0303 family) [Alpinimonas psychrophila]
MSEQRDTDALDLTALVAELEEQDRELRFVAFGYDDAWALGNDIVTLAREAKHPAAVAIFFGEQRVFHAALSGASVNNDSWLERKVRTVRRFNESSYLVGRRFALSGQKFETDAKVDPLLYAAHGGAFPLRVGDLQVGVVAVSGLPQEVDHAIIVAALRRALKRQQNTHTPGSSLS